jgi:hypothetical protein
VDEEQGETGEDATESDPGQPSQIPALITYITVCNEETDDQNETRRYPFVASELFGLGNNSISWKIASDTEQLDRLLSFITDSGETVNSVLAGYVSSALRGIIEKFAVQVVVPAYKQRVLQGLVRHVYC